MQKEINRIKIVLAETKRKNKWLADQLNKDESTISLWCTNKRQPSLETLVAISEVLNVDVRELLEPTNLE